MLQYNAAEVNPALPLDTDARPCPLCGGVAGHAFSVADRNRGIPSSPFEYRRCTRCQTYFLARIPDDLAAHYPSDYHSYPSGRELDWNVRAQKPKLKLLRAVAPAGRLLEIGPGAGFFVRAAVEAGFDVTTIEMDSRCCEYIEAAGARAICSDQPAEALKSLSSFDAIAMWHVIEHLQDPWAVLIQAAGRLDPGGALIVATPNPQALQFRLLGRYWAHVDAPRHLFLIPSAALTAKALELGLRHVMTTTSDRAGRGWDRMGWEYALRRYPAAHPSTLTTRLLSALITAGLRPWETRDLAGATYTSLFVRPAAQE